MVARRRGVTRMARSAAKAGFVSVDALRRRAPGPRILIYHQVGAGLGRQMEVSIEEFEYQLAWLAANGTVVDLATAINNRAESGADRMFVLTFDDGYDDLHRLAFPRLVAAAFPFTLYLTTGPIETGTPLTPGGGADPLTWSQVEDMLSSGLMTLGAHTHSHPDLRTADADLVDRELTESDRLITLRTGVRPEHFAYPWGYWAATADAAIRRRYQSAVLGSGKPVTGRSEPHTLNRIPVQLDDHGWVFRAKMRHGLPVEDWVRRRLSRYGGP